MKKTKAYEISKEVVEKSYRKVKANKGGAGGDNESMKDFEKNLENNLYKLWNRMSSATYFPPPVKVVEIPKGNNDVRTLGIPTITDRIAQMVVKSYLEPVVDPTFHKDSYGYRPNKSAVEAVGRTRVRCWKYDWVIDLDIKGFFDNIDHTLMLDIVRKHTSERWILLYIKRWLKAPAQVGNELVKRNLGTPQGGVISPLLANMFLDFVFDKWMEKEHPLVPFERYADDIIVHCSAKDKPLNLLATIKQRFMDFKLEVHPKKTKVVYCKDDNRGGKYTNESFDFLGFTFRARPAKNKWGKLFVSFIPAISLKAKKSLRDKIRSWKIRKRSHSSFEEIAELVNPAIRGWINYYGSYCKTALYPVLRQLEYSLVKWVMRKFKKYRGKSQKVVNMLGNMRKQNTRLFAHWKFENTCA